MKKVTTERVSSIELSHVRAEANHTQRMYEMIGAITRFAQVFEERNDKQQVTTLADGLQCTISAEFLIGNLPSTRRCELDVQFNHDQVREGEPLEIDLSLRDTTPWDRAYLHIYTIDDRGNIDLFSPSSEMPQQQILRGRKLHFPNAEMRKRGDSIQPVLPKGRKESEEGLFVFALAKPGVLPRSTMTSSKFSGDANLAIGRLFHSFLSAVEDPSDVCWAIRTYRIIPK